MNTERLFGVHSSQECSAPLIYGPANKNCSIKGRNAFTLAKEIGAVKGEAFEHNSSGWAAESVKRERL